jgi:hypothetical protein
MPCKAMQKLRVRKGCMFKCACAPPTVVTVAGAKLVRLAAGAYALLTAPNTTELPGTGTLPLLEELCATWIWVGNSAIESV